MTPDLPLPEWLAQAQQGHADAPQAVAAQLLARAARLPADSDGAAAVRLAEHVMLAHLADDAALRTFLAALNPAAGAAATRDAAGAEAADRAGPAALQAACARARWAAGVMAGIEGLRPTAVMVPEAAPAALDPAPGGPPTAERWRVLQNLVLALARQGRLSAAGDWLRAPRQAAIAHPDADARRAYAASTNNVAGDLRAERRGDAPDLADRDALMLEAATLARHAWAAAGTWLQVERADYQLALCHAATGDAAAARHCAAACLARCEAEGADAVERFFGHEALARAEAAAGDTGAFDRQCMQMHDLIQVIADADMQAWCRQVLADLPRP